MGFQAVTVEQAQALGLMQIGECASVDAADEPALTQSNVAFEVMTKNGAVIKATYLPPPSQNALVEIIKDGAHIKSFEWPAYQIWNVAAHAEEFAADAERLE